MVTKVESRKLKVQKTAKYEVVWIFEGIENGVGVWVDIGIESSPYCCHF